MQLALRQQSRPAFAGRWYRPVAFGLFMLAVAAGLAIGQARWWTFSSRGIVGIDFDTYLAFARRWLDTGSMYLPTQIAGPFDARPLPHIPPIMPSMYPPIAVALFVPFLALPSFLWWAIPLVGLVAFVVAFRPAPWTWPVMALALLWPPTWGVIAAGNTTLWIAAAIAAGLHYGWPVLLLAIKPTLAPFLLIGVRRRSFWIGAAVLAVASLVMLGETIRYVAVVLNATNAGLAYSFGDLPLVLVPVIAWLGRSLRTRRAEGDDEGSRLRLGHDHDDLQAA